MLNKIWPLILVGMTSSLVAQQLHDPTKPKVSSSAQETQVLKAKTPLLTLNSIQISAGIPIAIINQHAYHIGHRVGLERIKTISSNQVVFSSGKVLALFDQSFVSISVKD